MSEPTKARRDRIEQLLDLIEETDEWVVVEDRDEPLPRDASSERSPSERSRDAIDAVKTAFDQADGRLPAETVLDAAAERDGVARDDAADAVESLKQMGEVYEPEQDVLACTFRE